MNKDLFIKVFPSVLMFLITLVSYILRKIIVKKSSRGKKLIDIVDKYLLDFVVICEKYVGSGGGNFKKELVVDMLFNKFNYEGIKVVDKDLATIYTKIDNLVSKLNEFNKKI